MSWRSGSTAFSARWNTRWGKKQESQDVELEMEACQKDGDGFARVTECTSYLGTLHLFTQQPHFQASSKTHRRLPILEQQSINLLLSFPKGRNLQIKSIAFIRTNTVFISLGHTAPLPRDTHYPPNKTDTILFTAL